jgi:hypothetical protein
MAEVQIMTGNQAAALGAKLSHVQVVAAYPITPQTSVTEMLSQLIEGGELKAEYIRVESEHSALAVCISASTVGARVFTSTSSQGLLYMHEQIHWAAGGGIPSWLAGCQSINSQRTGEVRYFGIKTCKKESQDSYIWWITDSSHNSWMSFFSNPDKERQFNAFRLPLAEAIKAYQSIGYECVELEVIEKSAEGE